MRNIVAAAGAALLLSAVAANAAAIKTAPAPLIANGAVTAIYVYNSAGDTNELSLSAPTVMSNIFCNNTGGVCSSASAIGSTVSLGSFTNASLVFTLSNLSTTTDFTTNLPDLDGNYHAVVSADYSSLGISGPNPIQSFLDGLTPGTTVTYVAWEDLTAAQGSDFDYNDLVFAFTNVATTTTTVPEPISISLFGAGLAGAAWINKRRKAKKA